MLRGIKKGLIVVFNRMYQILYGYARWVLLFVILIVSMQVVARNVFQSNIRWNQEIALLLTIWMAFAGIAIGVEKNLHIAVEMFYSWFPKTMKKVVESTDSNTTSRCRGNFLVLWGQNLYLYQHFYITSYKTSFYIDVYYDSD